MTRPLVSLAALGAGVRGGGGGDIRGDPWPHTSPGGRQVATHRV